MVTIALWYLMTGGKNKVRDIYWMVSTLCTTVDHHLMGPLWGVYMRTTPCIGD
jgi:hypothetical protein